MDQLINFKQRSRRKSIALFVVYGVFLIAVTVFIGAGQFGILDLINSSSAARLIIGAILLSPLFFLIKLTKYNIEIRISNNKIEIKDKQIIEIPINKIDKIVLHEPRTNTLNLYARQQLLYCFDTGEGSASLMEIAHTILMVTELKKTIRKRKIIGGSIEVVEYSKA